MAWPKQSPAAMNAFYGNPDANGDGAPDQKWEAANLVTIKPPYRMVLAWDPAKAVKSIRVHKDCAESLMRILSAIGAHYGSQAAIEKARMHLFGGCYNFRLKRGGSTLSIHSWGAAIDLDPERNGFGVKWRDGKGMMPLAVARIFEADGWDWGGPWADAMHFQAAKTGQKAFAATPAGKAPVPAARPPAALAPAPEATGERELVEAVQKALIERGYHEVGTPDGKFGRKTRGAILAFEADNALPLTGNASGDLLAAILAAASRPVSEDRAEGKPEDKTVINGANGIATVGTGVTVTGGLALAEPVVKAVEGGSGLVARVRAAIDPLTDFIFAFWPLLLVAAGLAVLFLALNTKKKVIADFREGKIVR